MVPVVSPTWLPSERSQVTFGTAMITVSIAAELKKKCPRATLGCVEATVTTAPSPEALNELLHACEEHFAKSLDGRATLDAPAIRATRAGYKALGKDPARYRGSAEALLRRLIAGKGLPHINNVVDVINLVSVESRLPIGLYDLAKVEGAIEFRAGRPGETYKGIGKYDLNLEGLPLFADAKGPHGSATSDSERTMVTEATTRVAAVLVSFGGTGGLEEWTQRLAKLLTEHAGGNSIETRVVS
jgi:DNA/RNA-binding domain of Phe-tRNA-synthetase-like protein